MRKSVLLLLALILSAFPVMSQSNYAVLGGSVFDPQKASIAGATLELIATATKAERHGWSN